MFVDLVEIVVVVTFFVYNFCEERRRNEVEEAMWPPPKTRFRPIISHPPSSGGFLSNEGGGGGGGMWGGRLIDVGRKEKKGDFCARETKWEGGCCSLLVSICWKTSSPVPSFPPPLFFLFLSQSHGDEMCSQRSFPPPSFLLFPTLGATYVRRGQEETREDEVVETEEDDFHFPPTGLFAGKKNKSSPP